MTKLDGWRFIHLQVPPYVYKGSEGDIQIKNVKGDEE